jgi:hypothetical protein
MVVVRCITLVEQREEEEEQKFLQSRFKKCNKNT